MVRLMAWQDGEHGYVTVLLPFLVAVAALCTVVLLDLVAYIASGMRAQTAADMAALAAAAPAEFTYGLSGAARAEVIADAYGATVTVCDCHPWREIVRVEVQVSVPARALPHLGGARHVTAVASAMVTG
jgi:hypothetical protein